MPSATKVQTGYLEAVNPFTLASGTASAPSLTFSGSSATGMFSPSTGDLAFSTGNTQNALRILSDGKVGIGTTNPGSKLDVFEGSLFVGSHYVSTINTDYKIRLRSVGAANNNNYTAEIGLSGNGPQPADSSLTFSTQIWNGSAYVITEKARITSSGNLGIGTTDPSSTSKLHVYSSGINYIFNEVGDGTNCGVRLKNTQNDWYVINDSNGDLQFYNVATSSISAIINDSGNVGIGTNNPSSTLTVRSPGASTTFFNALNSGNTSILRLTQTSGGSGYLELRDSTDATFMVADAANGRVGIGVTDPKSKLHIESLTGTSTYLTISQLKTYLIGSTNERAGINLSIREASSAITADTRIFARIDTGPESDTTSGESFLAFHTRLGGALTEKIRINSLGNIVKQYDTGLYSVTSGGSTSHMISYGPWNGTPNILTVGNTFDGIVLATGGGTMSEKIRITAAGNVGIGTTNPVTTLDVRGAQKIERNVNAEGAQLFLRNTNTGSGAYSVIRFSENSDLGIGSNAYIHYFNTNWASNGYWDAKSLATGTENGNINFSVGGNNIFKIWTNNSPRLYVFGNGSVGIGTTTLYNNDKLQVEGTTRISARDKANTGETLILSTTDATNKMELLFGHNTSSYYRIQAINQNIVYVPVLLNNDGGNVGIRTTNADCTLAVGTGNTRLASGYTRMITGYKGGSSTSNTNAFTMFDIYGIFREDFTELIIKHGHEGGGMHGSYRRWIFTSNAGNAIQTFEDTGNINYGGGNGFTFSFPTYGTLRVTWNGASSFADGYIMTCWIRTRANVSFINQGMDQFYS